jgi:hypothetical protein
LSAWTNADFENADVTSTRLIGLRGRDKARNLDRVRNLDRRPQRLARVPGIPMLLVSIAMLQ